MWGGSWYVGGLLIGFLVGFSVGLVFFIRKWTTKATEIALD